MGDPRTADAPEKSPARAPGRRATPVAVVVTALLLAVAALSMLLPAAPLPARAQSTPEHAAQFHFGDSTKARRAHRLLLVTTAFGVLALAGSRRLRGRALELSERLAERPLVTRFVPAAAGVVAVASSFRHPLAGAVGCALSAGAVFAAARPRFGRPGTRVAALLLSAYALVALIPALLWPADLTTPGRLEAAEWHYGVVVSQGDRLACGLRLFRNIAPHYGVLTPALLALAERAHGLYSFGAHIRMVQVMELLFCGTAFLCYRRWSGGRIIPLALALLPVLAFASTAHDGVLFPNQSGWRSLGLPVGLLPLLYLGKERPRRFAALGVLLGALLLFNPETAVVIAFADLTFAASGVRGKGDWQGLMARALLLGVGALGVLLVFVFAYRGFFGVLPLPDAEGVGLTFTRFSNGYGGVSLYFDLLWVLILAHCVMELVRAALELPSLSERRRIRASIAAATVLWFSYFFNRAHPWNLWTFFFLYGFFVIDLAEPERLAAAVLGRASGVVAVGALVLVLSGAAEDMLRSGVRGARLAVAALTHRSPPDTELLSGVYVRPSVAAQVREKARVVAELAPRGGLYYFTMHMYLVPLLTGFYPDMPAEDAYTESFTPSDFDRIIDWIHTEAPGTLLFDDPTAGDAGHPRRQEFFVRFKAALSDRYRLAQRRSGWEVWARR